jgi:hypothetical protein
MDRNGSKRYGIFFLAVDKWQKRYVIVQPLKKVATQPERRLLSAISRFVEQNGSCLAGLQVMKG